MSAVLAVTRIFAGPLFVAAFWALVLEPRWYRVFRLLVMLFALVVMMGYVALD